MSSHPSAELRTNNVIVRDFSSIGTEQHPEQSPSQEGEEEEDEEEEEATRSGLSTTDTTAKTPTITTTDRHAKLPYTRFYSPKWTSQHQPPQDSMLPPPISSCHPSASRPSRARSHRPSNESDMSYGSQYSTMPYGSQYATMPYEQHYRIKGSNTVPSRRASTGHGVSSGYTSDGSRYSTDLGGGMNREVGRDRARVSRDEDRYR